MNQFKWVLMVVAIAIAVGCHLRPNLGAPGTIGMQRNRAVLHDPYPSNDLGPPIASGRPLGFDRPLSETQGLQGSPFAAQSLNRSLFNRGPVAPQPLPPVNPPGY